jgi:hypothetical protein
MTTDGDEEKYQLKILSIALFVPVAQLAAPVYQELNSIMTRKTDPQTIGIHYRRVEVRPINLVPNNEEYNSGTLFTDSDLPCKIVICFVKTKSKNGDYHANPFELRRSWDVPNNVILVAPDLSQKSERELLLEKRVQEQAKRVHDMEETIRLFKTFYPLPQNPHTTRKGKGRGKKSAKNTDNNFAEEVQKEAERRLRSFLQENQQNSSTTSEHSLPGCSHSSFPIPSAPPMDSSVWTEDNSSVAGSGCSGQRNIEATTTNVHIKKIEVTLNGVPLDQVCLKIVSK